MNPLTNVRNITKLSEQELKLGIDIKNSWHNMYKNSAWVFIGGLSFDLSEGDIIAVFSQYGEIVNINLIRDRKTGKSKGFGFLCYQDQRSTILAVDNLNGIKLLNRTIRVDHVEEYKVPKELDDITPEMKQLYNEGCAPKAIAIVQPTVERTNLQEKSDHKHSNKKKSVNEKNTKSHKEKKHKKRSRKSSDSSDSSIDTRKRKHSKKKSICK
ncbi:RNA-binding motif protein, X-linked 2 [Blomia tropicalis]|nr:RNA-binding motif protein, X-linked 2 [Blomia tropicalis]